MRRILIFAGILLFIASLSYGFQFIGGQPAASGVDEGFVGNNTGTGAGTTGGVNDVARQTFSATTSGTIGYIHARITDADGKYVNAAIYDNSGDLLRDGTLTLVSGTPDIVSIALDSTLDITQGESYTLLIGSSDDTYWRVSSNAGTGGTAYYDIASTVGDTMPSTLPTGGSTLSNTSLVIWADNTP